MRNDKVMHQNVKWDRVELVEEAPIGLYTELRKIETFEMDAMQKLHVGKLSNFAHIISTHGCLYQYR